MAERCSEFVMVLIWPAGESAVHWTLLAACTTSTTKISYTSTYVRSWICELGSCSKYICPSAAHVRWHILFYVSYCFFIICIPNKHSSAALQLYLGYANPLCSALIIYWLLFMLIWLQLKSPNVLLARDGTAKIADYGLAKVSDSNIGCFFWKLPLLFVLRCCPLTSTLHRNRSKCKVISLEALEILKSGMLPAVLVRIVYGLLLHSKGQEFICISLTLGTDAHPGKLCWGYMSY